MKAADIMTRRVVTVRADEPVVAALRKLLDERVSGAPVVSSAGVLVGILTESDFLRRAEIATERRRPGWLDFLLGPGRAADDYVRAHGRRVEEVMTSDVLTVAEDTTLDEIIALMESRRVKQLPVVSDGTLVGIVSRTDIVRAFVAAASEASAFDTSDSAIRRRIGAEIASQNWTPRESIRIGVSAGVVDIDGTVIDERLRTALRVLIENVAGVRRVRDHLATIEPMTGTVVASPDD